MAKIYPFAKFYFANYFHSAICQTLTPPNIPYGNCVPVVVDILVTFTSTAKSINGFLLIVITNSAIVPSSKLYCDGLKFTATR